MSQRPRKKEGRISKDFIKQTKYNDVKEKEGLDDLLDFIYTTNTEKIKKINKIVTEFNEEAQPDSHEVECLS